MSLLSRSEDEKDAFDKVFPDGARASQRVAPTIQELYFAETDKWVTQLDGLDFIVLGEARTVPIGSKGGNLSDAFFNGLRGYKDARILHSAYMQNYRYLENELKAVPEDARTKKVPANETEFYAMLAYNTNRIRFEKVTQQLTTIRESKLAAARTLLACIDKAISTGVLKEGEGLKRKLKECKENATQLDSEHDALVNQYTLLDAEYSRLEWEYNLLYYQSHVGQR